DGYGHQFSRVNADPKVIKAYNRWLLRNRINGEQSKKMPSLYTYGSFHMAQPYPYHTFDLFVPPEKYFKTHPEYFAMNEHGKRFPPDRPHVGGSLCLSNPEVAKVTLNTLREMIRKDHAEHPKEEWAYVYDISRLDAISYICKCPKCLAIIKEEGTELGLLMRYINTVAREIRKEYPEIIIRTSGSLSNNPPPTKTLPESNVLIRIGDKFTYSDPFVPLSSPINKKSKEVFESWKNIAKKMALWDYWNLGGDVYFNPPRVETVFDSIQSDLQYFRDIGITDIFIEASRDYAFPQNFIDATYFVANQLLVDPDDDPEKLVDIFFRNYYGPAAPALKKWFNEIRAGIKKHPGRQASMGVGNWIYADVSFIFNSYLMLKKASESLPENSVYRDRTDWERIAVIGYILAHRPSFQKVLQKHDLKFDDLIAECRLLVKRYIRRFPCKRPEAFDRDFEKRFSPYVNELKRPAKFKDVPEENFRMIAWPDLRGSRQLCSQVENDPESIQGKALKSAHKESSYHGVDIVLPGRGRFRSTLFQLRNAVELGGAVTLRLKEVPQDEKYHWFKFPGSFEFKQRSAFWGNGWAIQGKTNHLYMLTDGTASDNTWDEVWMSAKFTGPAYVPGSKKENAIWVDMLVLIRKTPKE
ncbi:MAG: DUF4838 domain-containing protein, partial [Lentisphaeria bacterium]|nr:DUF4838 domain-containing protein [Lentisphaeria bacterium]